jgi:hypothetical protein
MPKTVGHHLMLFSVLCFMNSRCWMPFCELSDPLYNGLTYAYLAPRSYLSRGKINSMSQTSKRNTLPLLFLRCWLPSHSNVLKRFKLFKICLVADVEILRCTIRPDSAKRLLVPFPSTFPIYWIRVLTIGMEKRSRCS